MPRFLKRPQGCLKRAFAIAFAQHLFYQPLMAPVARQETDPGGSARATGRDPVVRADGECTNPFGEGVLNGFRAWRSGMETFSKAANQCHFVPSTENDS
jgi:hypothetical protein